MKRMIFAALLFIAAMCFATSAFEAPKTVSIGINASAPTESVALGADLGIYTYAPFAATEGASSPYLIGNNVTVTVSEGGTLLCNGAETGLAAVDFFKAGDFISCQGKLYRGDIRLSVKNGGILIVNNILIEEYLYGVVGREMSEGFPLEALKAQAVAARNYTAISMGRHSSDGFDLCNGVHCQAYGAVASEGENVRRAVDETAGKYLMYKGAPVQCYYYSSNGGFSENSENVWVAELGYLKGKADPYEDASKIPNYNWTVAFTAEDIKTTLAGRGIDIGDITDVKVKSYSVNNHALELEITGTTGTKSYFKDNIRAAMPKSLNSTVFTVTKTGGGEISVLTATGIVKKSNVSGAVLTGDGRAYVGGNADGLSFIFSGSGWGHGVGMSQYGAKAMAEQGFNYGDILKFYFTDTEISD